MDWRVAPVAATGSTDQRPSTVDLLRRPVRERRHPNTKKGLDGDRGQLCGNTAPPWE
jgi:hypothetical protein